MQRQCDGREALVFRALCVLTEAHDQARNGRVARSSALRLALAYLYHVGDRRAEHFDRQPYDEFWKLATTQDAHVGDAKGYGRLITMTSCLNGIARAAGLPLEVAVMHEIGAAITRDRDN